MPPGKMRLAKKSDNALKGSSFEDLVRKVLEEGRQLSGGRLTYRSKPKLKLQNSEIVIPDFVVKTVSPHEERNFYIECQNRQRSTKSILHKIQHVRSKHKAKTFFYVYAKTLGSELARAFESESIPSHSLAEFRFFILGAASSINYRVSHAQVVRRLTTVSGTSQLPLPKKVITALHSHPDSKKLIEKFLNGERTEFDSEKSSERGGERTRGSPNSGGHGSDSA